MHNTNTNVYLEFDVDRTGLQAIKAGTAYMEIIFENVIRSTDYNPGDDISCYLYGSFSGADKRCIISKKSSSSPDDPAIIRIENLDNTFSGSTTDYKIAFDGIKIPTITSRTLFTLTMNLYYYDSDDTTSDKLMLEQSKFENIFDIIKDTVGTLSYTAGDATLDTVSPLYADTTTSDPDKIYTIPLPTTTNN